MPVRVLTSYPSWSQQTAFSGRKVLSAQGERRRQKQQFCLSPSLNRQKCTESWDHLRCSTQACSQSARGQHKITLNIYTRILPSCLLWVLCSCLHSRSAVLLLVLQISFFLPSDWLPSWAEVLAFALALEKMWYGCMAAKLLVNLLEHCLEASRHYSGVAVVLSLHKMHHTLLTS